jgi:hypothetical protein
MTYRKTPSFQTAVVGVVNCETAIGQSLQESSRPSGAGLDPTHIQLFANLTQSLTGRHCWIRVFFDKLFGPFNTLRDRYFRQPLFWFH